MLPLVKSASPQSQAVYHLLSDGSVLTAQAIAEKLNIVPNSVYRLLKRLMSLGLVEEVQSYPISYRAVTPQTALSFYLLAASQNFRREFGMKTNGNFANGSPKISLIKDRPTLLNRTEQDVRQCSESIDIIVSGHEIPDVMYLAHIKAIANGAKVRRIVHQKDKQFTRENKLWKEFGAEVRYLPDFSLRMLIYDKRILYITSFDPKTPESAFGVRFEYGPLAMQMTELFEQKWQRAAVI
jgi:sugar-specific transcriptional regulator TrmB